MDGEVSIKRPIHFVVNGIMYVVTFKWNKYCKWNKCMLVHFVGLKWSFIKLLYTQISLNKYYLKVRFN